MDPKRQREERTLRALQAIVDNAGRRIVTGHLSREQAEALAAETREAASHFVPDQMQTYDLIYGARFKRWIEQFCAEDA